MFWLKTLAALLLGAVILTGSVTYVALESGNVLTAQTIDQKTGEARDTHIWFVEDERGLFLEAGSPQNPWVQDLVDGSTLGLKGKGVDGDYQFVIQPGRHSEIRTMMRARYGWRDRWIGLLFDVSRSQLIEVKKND